VTEKSASESFSERATAKGLDPDRLQASLRRIGGSSIQQEQIKAQRGAGRLKRALEAQGPSPAQKAAEAAARQKRLNTVAFGIDDPGGELPSQRPPAPSAPGWLKHVHQETQSRARGPTPEEQEEIDRIDRENLEKAQRGFPQKKADEPVR